LVRAIRFEKKNEEEGEKRNINRYIENEAVDWLKWADSEHRPIESRLSMKSNNRTNTQLVVLIQHERQLL